MEQRDELHRKLLSLENAVSAASHLEVTMAHVHVHNDYIIMSNYIIMVGVKHVVTVVKLLS